MAEQKYPGDAEKSESSSKVFCTTDLSGTVGRTEETLGGGFIAAIFFLIAGVLGFFASFKRNEKDLEPTRWDVISPISWLAIMFGSSSTLDERKDQVKIIHVVSGVAFVVSIILFSALPIYDWTYTVCKVGEDEYKLYEKYYIKVSG